MKMIKWFFIFCCQTLIFSAYAQFTVVKKSEAPLIIKDLFGADPFGTIYYTKANNAFVKQAKDTIVTYTNFQLGPIDSANTFNPLKINLFYKDFNMAIILDNRLAEIYKIDFNRLNPYRNVSFVSTGFDNTLWIFNQDLQQLELYDYKAENIRLKTVPIQSEILDLKSDYNYCYLLTKDYLYIYNYFGSLIAQHQNLGYEQLALGKANVILKSDQNLFILPKNEATIAPVIMPNLLIKQFLVTNETLYIYDGVKLHQFQLKKS